MDSGALPPYVPDGALPPIPEQPVDGEFLRRRYRISKAAFHNRKNALPHVTGIRQGKRVLFLPTEVFAFDALDWYLDKGFTLEEVAEAQKGFTAAVVPEEDEQDEKLIQKVEPPAQGELNLSPQALQGLKFLADEIGSNIFKQLPRPQTDPLRTLRLLEEAADKEYVLTTRMLAEILDFSVASVRSFKPVHERHGFEITKVETGKWTVRRLKKAGKKAPTPGTK